MNYEVLEAIGQITREKDIDREVLLETLEAGLVSATKKKYSDDLDVDVTVNLETGDISIYILKKVVTDVTDPDHEISLTDEDYIANGFDAEPGDTVYIPVPFDDFGRNAVLAAKQVFYQKVREARREKIYNEFKDKVGQLISGIVHSIERGNIIVHLGSSEGFLPWRHQIRREKYSQGESIRALLYEVSNNIKGPQIILSRTHPDFVRTLFALETPEIREGIVRIEGVAREAGVRTKLAVSSREARVDAVGACVGVKGIRVQSVVRELGGERMDIIPHTSDVSMFIARALSPARVEHVVLNDEEKKAVVVVPDDQLSLAIGKGGQNVRLASQLTEWAIELMTDTQWGEIHETTPAEWIEVSELSGIGEKLSRELEMAGFENVHDVAEASVEQLTAVPGIGAVRAERLIESAKSIMKQARKIRSKRKKEAKKAAEETQTNNTDMSEKNVGNEIQEVPPSSEESEGDNTASESGKNETNSIDN